jgi:3-oxoadipate CoA-transferase beta subunit
LSCGPDGLRLVDTVEGLSHADLVNLIGLPIQPASSAGH